MLNSQLGSKLRHILISKMFAVVFNDGLRHTKYGNNMIEKEQGSSFFCFYEM